MNYLYIESKAASSASLMKRKPIFGVFTNDAPFNSSLSIGGKRLTHEGYQAWVHMIHRCYGVSAGKYPTYQGAEVCREWRSFMAFRDWWLTMYVPGWCLDKDLLGDGKLYSPSTCLYIPQELNKLLNTKSRFRGAQPLGVTLYKGKYRAMVSNPLTDLHEFLGDFKTPQEAHQAWRSAKEEIAEGLKETLDTIDSRLYAIVKAKIAAMR